MNKKISVIIPIYNCEKYLKRLLDSIINQNEKSLEIILINDGSTDNSLDILKNYEKKYKNIKVINKKNGGVSKSRNDGLNIATGKYICFLDADDYIDKDYFKEILKLLNKYNVELLNFGFFSDVENNKLEQISSDIVNYKNKLYQTHNDIKKDFVNLWDNTMLYNIWNKVYLKEIIDKNNISFPNYNWGEDIAFNREYLNSISSMYNSNKAFYHYIREREGSITKEYKQEIFTTRKREFKEINDYFDSWDIKKEDYYEFSCRRYIERLLGCLENLYCSNMNFPNRYKEAKKFINDPLTRETLKHVKPKSNKIKIMLIPIRLRLTLVAMLMGKILNNIKTKFPAFFNKLKNRR